MSIMPQHGPTTRQTHGTTAALLRVFVSFKSKFLSSKSFVFVIEGVRRVYTAREQLGGKTKPKGSPGESQWIRSHVVEATRPAQPGSSECILSISCMISQLSQQRLAIRRSRSTSTVWAGRSKTQVCCDASCGRWASRLVRGVSTTKDSQFYHPDDRGPVQYT